MPLYVRLKRIRLYYFLCSQTLASFFLRSANTFFVDQTSSSLLADTFFVRKHSLCSFFVPQTLSSFLKQYAFKYIYASDQMLSSFRRRFVFSSLLIHFLRCSDTLLIKYLLFSANAIVVPQTLFSFPKHFFCSSARVVRVLSAAQGRLRTIPNEMENLWTSFF